MLKLLLVFVPLFALLGLGFLLVKWLEAKKKDQNGSASEPLQPTEPERPYPYAPCPGLLTDAELRFFAALENARKHLAQTDGWAKTRIMVQVPLGNLIKVKNDLDRSTWQTWHNKIDRKTIDFVIVDERCRPIVAIELDDSTHAKPSRQTRDAFVEGAFEDAGLRLVRIPGRGKYEAAEIAARLAGPMTDGAINRETRSQRNPSS
jgi:uncharacterized protein DUF2726